VRLKSSWEEEYKAWCQRDLSTKTYVYWWADGIYFNVRLDEEGSCVLVLIGALEDGTKELLAVVDRYRESTQSWRELLQQLKRQGLSTAPKLAIGDGSLGFWLALREEYGPMAQQRWLFTFYDFPAQHWSHLRTTNPIESTFATVRLRTQRTKGCGSRIATLTMVFKLGTQAQQHWRRLNGSELIPKVVTGVIFADGEELTQQAA
jgi:transposase-like protein